MTIVNDNSRVVNKLEASLTDDTKVIIYNRHMVLVQATGLGLLGLPCLIILALIWFIAIDINIQRASMHCQGLGFILPGISIS
jgi:hypothetical protein